MHLKWNPYALALKKPLQTATGVISQRNGVTLEYFPDEGQLSGLLKNNGKGMGSYNSCGPGREHDQDSDQPLRGDAAPLVGFSTETVASVQRWLHRHSTELEEWLRGSIKQIPSLSRPDIAGLSGLRTYLEDFFSKISPGCPVPPDLPSLRFASDSIILRAAMMHTLHDRKNPHLLPVPVNALIYAGMPDAALDEIWRSGINTLKLKIGLQLSSEKQYITRLINRFPEFRLRLDANGAFDLEEAAGLLKWLSVLPRIEYVEQPVSSSMLIYAGAELRTLGTRIAADESVRSPEDARQLISAQACDILILKPILIGGFLQLFQICKEAEQAGVDVVFTTSLESGTGRNMTAILAGLLGDTTLAHGINTGSLLAEDVQTDSDQIRNGKYYPII